MFSANTGSSILASAKDAGKEAAAKAKAGLDSIKIAFVYSGVQYDQNVLLRAVSEEIPGVPLIGNTSFTGVITPEGYITGEEGFVGILAFSDADMTVGVAAHQKNIDARADGAAAARAALAAAGRSDAPDYFYMAASPAEEEFYLKGITDVIGRVPFFGGSAADNAIAGQWSIFTDKEIFSDGVAVAFFYSAKSFANKYTGAYRESDKAGIITKIEGNRTLVEIDGVPALKKYAQWTSADPETLKGFPLLVAAITAPLGVKDRLGDLVAIRHPMNGNDDYSMAIGNNLAVGTAVIMMEASVDELIMSAGDTLGKLEQKLEGTPGAYHLVHCGGRRAGIGDRIEEVAEQIIKAAGGVPFIIEFTFGEYGYEDDGSNTCGGLMLSFTGFGK